MLGQTYSPKLINQAKGTSSPTPLNGTYIGIVVRISGGTYIKIPKLSPGTIFGPCKQFFQTTLSINDIVLCTFIDNKFDEVVLIGTSTAAVSPGVYATQEDIDNAARNLRIEFFMNVDI